MTLKSYVDSETSAWVKTVIDPAHARDYGCVGIPDENKMPTVVGSDRTTWTLDPSGYRNVSRWLKLSDGSYLGTTTPTEVTVNKVVVFNYNYGEIYAIWYVTGTLSNVTSDYVGVTTMTCPMVAAHGVNSVWRTVASGVTVDCIGQVMYTGGYFETGYFPPSITSSTAGTELYVSYPLSQESAYATRVASYQHGAYTVSRVNNYDWARVWNRATTSKGMVAGLSSGTAGSIMVQSMLVPESPDPHGKSGFDPSYIAYYPAGSTNWVLRVTLSYVREIQTPYYLGGTDGAKYDPRAVEAFMAISDACPFTWDASDNDLSRVLDRMRTWLRKNRRAIGGVVSTLPYGNTINAVLNALVRGPTMKQQAGQQLSEALAASGLRRTPAKRALPKGRVNRKPTQGKGGNGNRTRLPLVPATVTTYKV